jgi:hypothetical protein
MKLNGYFRYRTASFMSDRKQWHCHLQQLVINVAKLQQTRWIQHYTLIIVTCRADGLYHLWEANWFVPISWDLIVNNECTIMPKLRHNYNHLFQMAKSIEVIAWDVIKSYFFSFMSEPNIVILRHTWKSFSLM